MVTEALEEDQPGNMTSEIFVNTDLVRRAGLSLKPRKTVWGRLRREMISNCEVADWYWAVAFNMRNMNSLELDSHGVIAAPTWGRFDISLLPKANAPTCLRRAR